MTINYRDPVIDIIKLENLIFAGTPMLLLLFFTNQKRNHILMSFMHFKFLMIPSLLFSKNDLFSLIYILCAQVFLIAKDFGAWPAYVFANFHPERVLGVVTMGVPYLPPGSATSEKYLPEGYYVLRWRV